MGKGGEGHWVEVGDGEEGVQNSADPDVLLQDDGRLPDRVATVSRICLWSRAFSDRKDSAMSATGARRHQWNAGPGGVIVRRYPERYGPWLR